MVGTLSHPFPGLQARILGDVAAKAAIPQLGRQGGADLRVSGFPAAAPGARRAG